MPTGTHSRRSRPSDAPVREGLLATFRRQLMIPSRYAIQERWHAIVSPAYPWSSSCSSELANPAARAPSTSFCQASRDDPVDEAARLDQRKPVRPCDLATALRGTSSASSGFPRQSRQNPSVKSARDVRRARARSRVVSRDEAPPSPRRARSRSIAVSVLRPHDEAAQAFWLGVPCAAMAGSSSRVTRSSSDCSFWK